ncbi:MULTISPECIES: hypothetical protein [Rhodomicrobium]|uniref:hypothetical protein n=1 Tax=Rhodomicrobium TaxID=1068 RepID=UPI000B4BE4B7|nr:MULTISPECIES: hypothetical protein [Rhodomicrobium]
MFDPVAKSRHETELEEGVHAYLSFHFCGDIASPFRGQDFTVANTARGGERSGRWSRPDLTLVALQKFSYPRRIAIELFGFEIKRDMQADISSAFEAVAHTRFVHYAYVVWQVLPGSENYKIAKDIETSCQHHGIGLITFSDALSASSYAVRATPVRQHPHPWDVDEYLTKRLARPDQENLMNKIQSLQEQER